MSSASVLSPVLVPIRRAPLLRRCRRHHHPALIPRQYRSLQGDGGNRGGESRSDALTNGVVPSCWQGIVDLRATLLAPSTTRRAVSDLRHRGALILPLPDVILLWKRRRSHNIVVDERPSSSSLSVVLSGHRRRPRRRRHSSDHWQRDHDETITAVSPSDATTVTAATIITCGCMFRAGLLVPAARHRPPQSPVDACRPLLLALLPQPPLSLLRRV
jgi:hypothetical protein